MHLFQLSFSASEYHFAPWQNPTTHSAHEMETMKTQIPINRIQYGIPTVGRVHRYTMDHNDYVSEDFSQACIECTDVLCASLFPLFETKKEPQTTNAASTDFGSARNVCARCTLYAVCAETNNEFSLCMHSCVSLGTCKSICGNPPETCGIFFSSFELPQNSCFAVKATHTQ